MKRGRTAALVLIAAIFFVGFVSFAWGDAETRIVTNQLGAPRARTRAIVIAPRPLQNAELATSDGAGSARIVKRTHYPLITSWVHVVYLTPRSERGLQLNVRGGPARQIAVARDPYRELLRSLLRSYYLQRCGVAIVDRLGDGDHAACHVADGRRAHADLAGAEGAPITATGGWHDAGDFGKYVATTATVLLELLTRYERFPALLSADDLAIPESGNGIPDVLDEMRVGLDWMLAMQRSDGAVYRKLSGAAWPTAQPPEHDRQPRFVYGVSSSDSAKAAAAWALAARVYAPRDRALAQRYLAAARAAWTWLGTLDQQLFDLREGDNSGSGPYMANAVDREAALLTDHDDRLAAALELFLTTGEARFAQAIERALPEHALGLFEWKDVAALSVSSLLWHPGADGRTQWKQWAAQKLRARAEQGRRRAEQDAFSLANLRFVWGSNKMTAEEAVLMLAAARLGDASRLQTAAWAQLHYLLGANALDKVFVTGFGENPVAHVSHLFLRAAGRSLPGLMVGGPNELEQSNIAPRGRGPLSYADDARSYATNEYAIDYDSALIALLVDLAAAGMTPYAAGTAP